MTDVKFMDLSQNDNPATTDSVLIGNSTNGLKRTTVGAIGNLFSVKDLFHFETIAGQTDPTLASTSDRNSVAIVAPVVPGYSFVFWLNSSTVGEARASYVQSATNPQTNVWVVPIAGVNTSTEIRTVAVYVNSTVA